MSLTNDMKNLKEEILTSYKQRANEYQQRLKDNEELVKEVQTTLESFRKDQMEMASALRSNLAKGKKNRLNELGKLMTDIRENLMVNIKNNIAKIQQEVEDIQTSVANMLKDFSVTRGQMADELKGKFAEEETTRLHWDKNRLKEFDKMMKAIQKDILHIENEVKNIFADTNELLKKYDNEHLQMSAKLRNELKSNLTDRVEYTNTMLKKFQKRLSEISKENQKNASTLRKELSQNDTKRLNEFNVMSEGIQNKIHDIQKFVSTLLNDSLTDRTQAVKEWESIAKLKQKLDTFSTGKEQMPKTQKPIIEQKVVKAEVKKEEVKNVVKDVVKEEVKNEIPIKNETKIENSNNEKTLEEKVLNFVNAHKKGVNISEMEKPLGENRMRLGYVAKKLLDEGKILKIQNSYYPKSKDKSGW